VLAHEFDVVGAVLFDGQRGILEQGGLVRPVDLGLFDDPDARQSLELRFFVGPGGRQGKNQKGGEHGTSSRNCGRWD
jgi:hypothetical protein